MGFPLYSSEGREGSYLSANEGSDTTSLCVSTSSPFTWMCTWNQQLRVIHSHNHPYVYFKWSICIFCPIHIEWPFNLMHILILLYQFPYKKKHTVMMVSDTWIQGGGCNTSGSALGCRKKKGFRTGDLEREIRHTQHFSWYTFIQRYKQFLVLKELLTNNTHILGRPPTIAVSPGAVQGREKEIRYWPKMFKCFFSLKWTVSLTTVFWKQSIRLSWGFNSPMPVPAGATSLEKNSSAFFCLWWTAIQTTASRRPCAIKNSLQKLKVICSNCKRTVMLNTILNGKQKQTAYFIDRMWSICVLSAQNLNVDFSIVLQTQLSENSLGPKDDVSA